MNSWVYLAVLAASQSAADGKAEQAKTIAESKPPAPELRTAPAVVPPPAIEVAQAVRPRPARPNQVVEPTSPRARWVRGGDYPRDAIDEKRQGTTKVLLVVNDGGRVDQCTVTASSGHADLDAAACAVIERRAYFHPATDAEANPIASSYRHTIVWQLDDEAAAAPAAVQAIPAARPCKARPTARSRSR